MGVKFILRGFQSLGSSNFIKKTALFFWFFACGSVSLFSQQLSTSVIQAEHFTVENGLSHRNVRGICQDKRGMMWFGTAYGLNRFDGYEFKWFTVEKNGLAHNNIHHVHLDQEGNIWVFSGYDDTRSIDIVDPISESVQSFGEVFSGEVSFSLKEVLSYTSGPEGKSAFLLPGRIVIYQKKFTEILLPKEGALKKGKVFFGKDMVWLAAYAYGEKGNRLLQINEKGVVHEHLLSTGTANNYINVYQVEEDGSIRLSAFSHDLQNESAQQQFIHLSTDGSMERDTAAEKIFARHNTQLVYLRNFIQKIESNYWVNSYDQSLRVLSSAPSDTPLLLSETYPELKATNYLFEDNKGAVWVGSEFGVFAFQLKENQFQNFLSQEDGYNGFPMRGLQVTGSGEDKKLWGMVENRGELWSVDLARGEERLAKSIGSARWALDKTRNEELLFVSEKGIEQMNAQTETATKIYPHDFLSIATFTWKIHRDKYEKLWFDVANDGTLFVDEQGKLDTLRGWTGSVGETYLYQFIESETDTAWLVTNRGLFRFNIKTRQVVEHFWKGAKGRNYLPFDNIHHMWTGPDYFWLATAHTGLIKWHPDRGVIQQYTRADGLSNNTLYAAYPDDYGNIWLPSDYGINLLEEATGRVRTYTMQDGICNNEFNRLSHCRDEEGYLYLGTLDGITVFHPRDFFGDTTRFQAPMVITVFEQFDGDEDKLVDKTAELIRTQSITLQPNDPLIRLSFALLTYEQLENVQYAYRIEGVDENWTYQKENTLRLGRLPFGNYTLRIKGQAASGQWSSEELQIQIVSLRPFYLKLWFFALLAGTLLLAVFLFFRYREKSLREQQARLEKTVQERTATIEKQKEELKSLDELKSRFFANVSHELRTPLTLILGPLNRIIKSNENRPAKEAELLHFMQRNSQHLLKLVNEILDLSKLEKGKLDVELEPVSLMEFLEHTVDQFSSYAQANSISLKIEKYLSSDLNLLLDRNKVEKIIFNFISNALKFSSQGGTVTLAVREEEDFIMLKVVDSGSGIPSEDLPYVFDRFFQTKQKNKSPQGGTGIGLSLAKELAELLGGSVGVESEWGVGSTFWFRFPKNIFAGKPQPFDVEAPLVFAKKGQQSLKPVSPQQTKAKSILLVEDNVELRQYLRTILEDDYHCQTAENGQVAWDFLKNAATHELPDLIISDVMMPVMDGIELVEKIKGHDLLCQIPVIMLTARADIQVKINTLRTGVDDYVTKPFNEEELLVRIANLLKNYAGRRAVSVSENEQPSDSSLLATVTQEDREWLEAFETYVQENVTNELVTVSFLASEFAMSESTLRRQVNRLTGLSPKQYLQEVRLDCARQLLENRAFRTVSQVANEAGFSNHRTFTRNYKDRFGKFPSEYLAS